MGEETLYVKVGDVFRHFKGGVYAVTGFATDSENEELLVLYRKLGDPAAKVWARPVSMFSETVSVPRFARIEKEDAEKAKRKRRATVWVNVLKGVRPFSFLRKFTVFLTREQADVADDDRVACVPVVFEWSPGEGLEGGAKNEVED